VATAGYDPRPVVRTENATVTPFVLPDSPEIPVEPLRAADDRLLLAGYTLGSERVADLLVAAADRGVEVRVLIEGSPVGGFSARSARLLDRIVAAGVEVRVLDGNPERFRFHHAKYAVADDRAIVLTENWKASGTGGRTNRGWGVVTGTSRSSTDDGAVANDLAALFREDAAASDARSWSSFRNDTEFHESGTANESYPTRFEPPAATTADVELLTTPGTPPIAWSRGSTPPTTACWAWSHGPAGRITGSSAHSAGGPPSAASTFISCCPARGTTARRTALVDELADESRLRWPSPNREADSGRFTRRGSSSTTQPSSEASTGTRARRRRTERYCLLAVEDGSVADFYARAYAADWRGGGVHLPIGLLGGLGVALAGAGVIARREVAFV